MELYWILYEQDAKEMRDMAPGNEIYGDQGDSE